MFALPSSSAYMASAIQKCDPHHSETFRKFFECWLLEQNQYLQELIAASEQQQQEGPVKDQKLRCLVERVTSHYEQYYKAKSRWCNLDVLAMLSPSWTSKFEDGFLWIGGWRPSMAFHLIYSKSGLQLEDQLNELVRGLGRGDLGDLSPPQLSKMDELQNRTIREEKETSEKMAKIQEAVADSSMVELTHLVSEMMRRKPGGGDIDGEKERMESAMESKEEGLKEMLQRADKLRLKTLKGVIEVLSPTQAIHFLIAAAELHLRIHEWGKKRDNHDHAESCNTSLPAADAKTTKW